MCDLYAHMILLDYMHIIFMIVLHIDNHLEFVSKKIWACYQNRRKRIIKFMRIIK